jgi:hypothetical protein
MQILPLFACILGLGLLISYMRQDIVLGTKALRKFSPSAQPPEERLHLHHRLATVFTLHSFSLAGFDPVLRLSTAKQH